VGRLRVNLVLAASTSAGVAGTWLNWGLGWALLLLMVLGLLLGVFVLDDGTKGVPKR
jgi:hypothetical protein